MIKTQCMKFAFRKVRNMLNNNNVFESSCDIIVQKFGVFVLQQRILCFDILDFSVKIAF